MNNHVHNAYAKAHQIIWNYGYWKCLLIPILLSALLALILITVSYFGSSLITNFITASLADFVNLPKWLKAILSTLLFIILLGPCYILFRSLVMICYAPFLDRISKQAEEIINGSAQEVETTLINSIKRPIQMGLYSIIGILAVLLASLLLGILPIIGIVLSSAIVIPPNLFLSSIGYLDPYLERNAYTPKSSLKLMRQNALNVIYFGGIGFLITAIPIIGWFVGPTYSVVAGVVFSILIHNKKASEQNSKA